MGDADQLSVALLNRSLTNAQKVALELPFRATTSITRWWLEGNPRDTNLDALKVTLEHEQLSANLLKGGRMQVTIPAGTPEVYVFQR